MSTALDGVLQPLIRKLILRQDLTEDEAV